MGKWRHGRVIVAGAGPAGSVIARQLAEAGQPVAVYEGRDHVAGNCHTARDPETGVMLHTHGPHIFHTDDAAVWAFITRFCRMRPYRHKVRTVAGGKDYALPINLDTINSFFGRSFTPRDAQAFLARQCIDVSPPLTSEDHALSIMGRALYEAFFKGYTRKQWGRDPADLPAAILARLPVRFTADDRYFTHRFQGIPEDGYTSAVARMLDHPLIDLHLARAFDPAHAEACDHLFWTGPLDGFFGHRFGRLAYRTLDFETIRQERRPEGRARNVAVINQADAAVPYTRTTDHAALAPWEIHDNTCLIREYPRTCEPNDLPYYPVRLAGEKQLLGQYEALAGKLANVSFAGRLGTYRYLDMDVTIRASLDLAQDWLESRVVGVNMVKPARRLMAAA